jgi:hypothetical protein
MHGKLSEGDRHITENLQAYSMFSGKCREVFNESGPH